MVWLVRLLKGVRHEGGRRSFGGRRSCRSLLRADATRKVNSTLRGKFDGDELNIKLNRGGYLSMRMRPNGNEVEIVQRTGRGEIALEFYGVLSKQALPDG